MQVPSQALPLASCSTHSLRMASMTSPGYSLTSPPPQEASRVNDQMKPRADRPTMTCSLLDAPSYAASRGCAHGHLFNWSRELPARGDMSDNPEADSWEI